MREYTAKFIIDTDSYAGNFERELVDFCTGMSGEYVGSDGEFQEEFPEWYKKFSDVIVGIQHEEYGHIPAYLCETKGVYEEHGGKQYPSNNSVEIYFDPVPNEEMIQFLKQRAQLFAENEGIVITGFRLAERVITITEKSI